ncbi:hypothetical protein [Streptomyces sp. NPDC006879]|uniref:hypothetical protein n=1 Tax=Streptomyces sp. NPDC006879 TaxID=3364767 RepID=UPI00369C03F9
MDAPRTGLDKVELDKIELGQELDAAVKARRDLGPEYESALVDSFMEKLEARLDGAADRHVRRRLAEQQLAATRSGRHLAGTRSGLTDRFGFAVGALVLAIPLSAIGAAHAGGWGLLVVWTGILGVSFSQGFRLRRRGDSG